MRAVTYVRVSTHLQEVERQTDQLREYCSRNSIEIIKEFEDKDSGKNDKRSALLEMLEFIYDPINDVNCLMVHELSRLGRTYQVLDIIQDLTKRKISFYSIKEARWTIDQNGIEDPTTVMTLGFMAVINKHELETLKFRVKSGIERERKKGKALGGVYQPFGYKKDEFGMLVIDEYERTIVERIFKLYEDGDGTFTISKKLNSDDTPTRTQLINRKLNKDGVNYNILNKGEWSESTIHQILTNELYSLGKLKHRTGKTTKLKSNGLEYIRKFDYEHFYKPKLAFIPEELFKKVNDMLKNNNNKGKNSKEHDYLLENRKIICGKCGNYYYGYKRMKDEIMITHLYLCKSKRDKKVIRSTLKLSPHCGNCGIDIDKLDRLIQAVIFDKYSDILKENLNNKERDKDESKYENEIKRLTKVIKKEELDDKKLIDFYLLGRLKLEDYDIRHNLKKIIIENLNEKLNQENSKLADCKRSYNNYIDIKKLEYDFNRKNENLPKSVVNKILTNVKITKIEFAEEKFKDIFNKMISKSGDYFKNKQDKIILVEIISGVTNYYYFIGQREKVVFDLQDNSFKFPVAMGFKGFKEYIPIDNPIEEILPIDMNEKYIISDKYLTDEELEIQLEINRVDSLYDENKYENDDDE